MNVIYREESDRWLKGDRYVRPAIRKLLGRKSGHSSGMQTVVRNFLMGLSQKGITYSYNRPFFALGNSKKVISFGLGINGVKGLNRSNPVIAAIGFPYPEELPHLCKEYNIKKYLQHSSWVLEFVKSSNVYDSEIFEVWPAGIDTFEWKPVGNAAKKPIDVLIYNKLYWDEGAGERELTEPIRNFLHDNNYSFSEIVYGKYSKEGYHDKLSQAKAMLFLSAHESQGLAYQECLSSGVPVIALDQGYWLDPIRFKYNKPFVRATSVPFFDERCGVTFSNVSEFPQTFRLFFEDCLSGKFDPREFILENLSIEKSTERMLDIYNSV
jgi:glycosyltransferase involved in cell wall biosynthesis